MPIYVIMAAAAVTLSIPVMWYALSYDRAPGRRVAQNLTSGLSTGAEVRKLVLSQSRVERLLQPVLGGLGRRLHRSSPAGMVAALERKMELGGVRWSIEQLLAIKVCLMVLFLVGGMAFAATSFSGSTLLAAILAGAIGFFAPDSVIARKAKERQGKISNELPDTLDQLSICVNAGLGFDAALARVARSGRGPLSEEISRMLQELRVGVPRGEALDNLIARTDVAELRQFVHAISQAENYGVPVSGVLRSQATEQREKRRFKAEERAMKLPVKVVFPLVFCILPTMFIVILGPAALNVLDIFG